MKQEGLKKSFVYTIQQKIFSGEYQVGQQLPSERELAAELGISRSLVNTGLLELASQGFVRIIPRQGSVVADYRHNSTLQVLSTLIGCENFRLDYELLEQLMEMRVLIECDGARRASERIDASELETLETLVHCMQNAAPPVNSVEPMMRFHYLLTLYSGNAIYSMTYKSFEKALQRLLTLYLTKAPDQPKSVKLYDSLLRALAAHDAEASAHYTKLTIEQGLQALKKLYP